MASSFTQLTNIIRASEVAAKWGISAAELNERINRGKLRVYWHRDTRQHPDGTIIYLCDGPYMRVPDDNGEYDLTPYVFEIASIAEYEAANPEVLWSVVSGHKGEDSDDIPAEQVQHELGMDRPTFTDLLNNYFGDRIPTSLEDEFRSFAKNEGYDLNGHIPFFTIGMLKGLYIERLTWERWQREQKQKNLLQAKTDADMGEAAKLIADAAPLVAEAAVLSMNEDALKKEIAALKNEIAEKDTRITALMAELATTTGGNGKRDTSAATIGKLRKDLKSWQGALPMAVSATSAVLTGGKQLRTRKELRAICDACKASFSGVQFKAWRAVLPDGYFDKDDRSADPQNTVESIAGEGVISDDE